VLLTLLGNLYTMLWLDLYLSNHPQHTPETKSRIFFSVVSIILIITLFDLAAHMFIVFLLETDHTAQYYGFIIANNASSLMTSILLILVARLANKYVVLYFPGILGEKIGRRVKFITLIIVVSYEVKAIFPYVIGNMPSKSL
jgi:hypothetical protein